MKKYKRWIIGLSVVAGFLLVVVILMFTLFSVGPVEINFKNQTTIFAEKNTQEQVIDSAKLPYGTTIFALNKNKIKNNLESRNPYLKVVNIETVFPNKIIIHCAEREEVVIVETANDKYFICDQDLKILEKVTALNQVQGSPIFLTGVNILNNGAQIGEFLQFSEGENIIKSALGSLVANGKKIADCKGMFKKLELGFDTNYFTLKNEEVLTFTTYDNFEIKILNAEDKINLKTNYMIISLPELAKSYSSKRLIIDINPQNAKEYKILLEDINS